MSVVCVCARMHVCVRACVHMGNVFPHWGHSQTSSLNTSAQRLPSDWPWHSHTARVCTWVREWLCMLHRVSVDVYHWSREWDSDCICLHVKCHVQVCVCKVCALKRDRAFCSGGTLNHQLNRYQRTHRAKTFAVTFHCLCACTRARAHTHKVGQTVEGVWFWQPGGILFDVGQSEH